jgi:hypothetical protein
MSTSDKPANPNRYKNNARVFHEKHGWGKTLNPSTESQEVTADFGSEDIFTVHEDELLWPIEYNDRCVAFGVRLAEDGGLTWLYSPNELLGGKIPRDLIDDEKLDEVEEAFDKTFFF